MCSSDLGALSFLKGQIDRWGTRWIHKETFLLVHWCYRPRAGLATPNWKKSAMGACQAPANGLKSRFRRSTMSHRARSSAGEHLVDIEGVTGSIPVVPTIKSPALPAGLFLWPDHYKMCEHNVFAGVPTIKTPRETGGGCFCVNGWVAIG